MSESYFFVVLPISNSFVSTQIRKTTINNSSATWSHGKWLVHRGLRNGANLQVLYLKQNTHGFEAQENGSTAEVCQESVCFS